MGETGHRRPGGVFKEAGDCDRGQDDSNDGPFPESMPDEIEETVQLADQHAEKESGDEQIKAAVIRMAKGEVRENGGGEEDQHFLTDLCDADLRYAAGVKLDVQKYG